MENKKCFLDKLFTLLRTYGAKTLTMDDIAKEFSMSKKTLYKQYKNKEDLLYEVLEHISQEALAEVEKVRKEFACPMEVLFISGNRIDEVTCHEKNAFVFQLLKYYPEVFNAHQKSISVKIIDIIKNNYGKGVELGFFRKDVPIDLYIKFLTTLLFSVDVSPLFEEEKDKKSISIAMKVFYLEAIVTEKGKKRLNELKTKYE
ncbi:TetR/AcrR family transcriptional regulator [Cloacibacterium rupense]|nr:TetR/AcrR family transcriptional regulator [Cloacibacterium rupense]